jgi:hypothetical protein
MLYSSIAVALVAFAAKNGVQAQVVEDPTELLSGRGSFPSRGLFDLSAPFDFYGNECRGVYHPAEDHASVLNACAKCEERHAPCSRCCHLGASSLKLLWHGCPGTLTLTTKDQASEDCSIDLDETERDVRFIDCAYFDLVTNPGFGSVGCGLFDFITLTFSEHSAFFDVCFATVTRLAGGAYSLDLVSQSLPSVIGVQHAGFEGGGSTIYFDTTCTTADDEIMVPYASPLFPGYGKVFDTCPGEGLIDLGIDHYHGQPPSVSFLFEFMDGTCPGRGMGIADHPNLKIIGDVDPSDIIQGSLRDCWFLAAVSSLAKFDGAVKRLFRKTKHLDKMPLLDGPNMYTITLWDLSTWKEVDIVVDEILPVMADGSGQLLGAKPSEDGELWVCYLEKALAAQYGGWDKIDVGASLGHAFALITGCKHQHIISIYEKAGKYACYSIYNPYERAAWPEVGGGGDKEKELTEAELFLKLFAWDAANYLIGAGTGGTSDKHTIGGIVENHAYSVLECVNDVAGTDIDLIKVRNPWGEGEIEYGMFRDDGPGWDRYPQVKRALNPVTADDGIFWVTKNEFFKIYPFIYT